MIPGDKIRIYPHGSPEQAAEATVLLYGSKAPPEASLILVFDDMPAFASIRGGDIGLAGSEIVMFLGHYGAGPWVELFGGGHYEIEELS